jgi:hypothetical protein
MKSLDDKYTLKGTYRKYLKKKGALDRNNIYIILIQIKLFQLSQLTMEQSTPYTISLSSSITSFMFSSLKKSRSLNLEDLSKFKSAYPFIPILTSFSFALIYFFKCRQNKMIRLEEIMNRLSKIKPEIIMMVFNDLILEGIELRMSDNLLLIL